MTSSNLRDLLDEATLEIPPSVAQPPISAIRSRVKRRRAGFAAAGSAAVAVMLAVAIPFARQEGAPPPAASPPPIAWEFGFADDKALTVYATKLRKCTYLDDPVAVATRDGDAYTISLTGQLDTSGCDGPDAQGVSRSELAQATVTLDAAVPVDRIKDAASGQIRPIYARSELPVGFTGKPATGFSWGAQTSDGRAAQFSGTFQFHESVSPPGGITGLDYRGLGVSATPPFIADAEPATFGSIVGWLAPGAEGRSYRFVWHAPRGRSWITYELVPGAIMAPVVATKAEFVGLLNMLEWP
jgi:hypothetical protein